MKIVASLWEKIGNPAEKKIRCNVCAHHCIIKPNELGFCKTRKNLDGTLYSLIYGSLISSGSNDPIEKKPLYHFYPNSNAFSIATIGCNLRCEHCQNWQISKSFPDDEGKIALFSEQDRIDFRISNFKLQDMNPKQVVKNAKRSGSHIIAYTYNEPLIWFEFVRDTSMLAKKEGIKNVLVTGGYSSPQANQEYIKFIDAVNIDIKGFTKAFYKKNVGISNFQPILDTAIFFKENGIHVELTNLIIPNENDDMGDIERMIDWVSERLGNDTPLHFSAYHPEYHTQQPRTPTQTLKKAWKLAIDKGLKFVYMGNVIDSTGSSTFCPHCGAELIRRSGYQVQKVFLTDQNTCSKCKGQIAIKGKFSKSRRSFFL